MRYQVQCGCGASAVFDSCGNQYVEHKTQTAYETWNRTHAGCSQIAAGSAAAAEPTQRMVIAGFECEAWQALSSAAAAKGGWPYSCRESAECVKAIYKAMVAAAAEAKR